MQSTQCPWTLTDMPMPPGPLLDGRNMVPFANGPHSRKEESWPGPLAVMFSFCLDVIQLVLVGLVSVFSLTPAPPPPPSLSCSRTPSTPLPPRLHPEGCIAGEGVLDRVVRSGLGGGWRGLPNGLGAITAGWNCHFGGGGAAAAPLVRTEYETIATAEEQGNVARGTVLVPLPGHAKCGDGGRNLMAEPEHSRTQTRSLTLVGAPAESGCCWALSDPPQKNTGL